MVLPEAPLTPEEEDVLRCFCGDKGAINAPYAGPDAQVNATTSHYAHRSEIPTHHSPIQRSVSANLGLVLVQDEETAVGNAARNGKKTRLELLIKFGADLNKPNNVTTSPPAPYVPYR